MKIVLFRSFNCHILLAPLMYTERSIRINPKDDDNRVIGPTALASASINCSNVKRVTTMAPKGSRTQARGIAMPVCRFSGQAAGD